jgi:hypothetical protein
MLAAILLVLALLWAIAVVQPGGLDFLRVSLVTLNGQVLTIIDALIAIVIVGTMAAFRGAVALTGAALFVLFGLSIFGYVHIQGVPVAALAVLVIILGGVVQLMSHWARR